jgi:hypothetical protein
MIQKAHQNSSALQAHFVETPFSPFLAKTMALDARLS